MSVSSGHRAQRVADGWKYRAVCTCHWTGPRRFFMVSADRDARHHEEEKRRRV